VLYVQKVVVLKFSPTKLALFSTILKNFSCGEYLNSDTIQA